MFHKRSESGVGLVTIVSPDALPHSPRRHRPAVITSTSPPTADSHLLHMQEEAKEKQLRTLMPASPPHIYSPPNPTLPPLMITGVVRSPEETVAMLFPDVPSSPTATSPRQHPLSTLPPPPPPSLRNRFPPRVDRFFAIRAYKQQTASEKNKAVATSPRKQAGSPTTTSTVINLQLL